MNKQNIKSKNTNNCSGIRQEDVEDKSKNKKLLKPLGFALQQQSSDNIDISKMSSAEVDKYINQYFCSDEEEIVIYSDSESYLGYPSF